MSDAQANPYPTIDYDANDYDYQDYWEGRDYEQWSEDRVLRRLVPRLTPSTWFADFGGAYGRNAQYYLSRAAHAVILDYSATNLRNAARRHAAAVASGQLTLIRCDLNKVPFADHAFNGAIIVRVLHHLPDIDHALAEMGRCISSAWLLDVPIKHHLLGVVRGAARGRLGDVRSPEPLVTGESDEKYFNFQLSAVRARLGELGWRTRLGASANNFRRWEGGLPRSVVSAVRPIIEGMEACTQSLGKGWLGPSQFLLADREPVAEAPFAPDSGLAERLRCPHCKGSLAVSVDTAACSSCSGAFPKNGPFWDFV
jgi:SAM-dependent methyltransferase